MTSYGIWNGGSSSNCAEPSPYADNGYDSDTLCEECGWFRGNISVSGERYPSWRFATRRIEELREEYSQYSKELIANTVSMAGEDDMDGAKAREGMQLTQAAQTMEKEFPNLSTDDVIWVVSSITQSDINILDDLDKVRELLESLEKKREIRKAKQVELGGKFDTYFDLAEGELMIEINQALNGCASIAAKKAPRSDEQSARWLCIAVANVRRHRGEIRSVHTESNASPTARTLRLYLGTGS